MSDTIQGASLFVRATEDSPTGWGLFAAQTKQVQEGEDETQDVTRATVSVLASEAVEDRMGDIVAPPWNLAHFKRNPVILFGHDSQSPPVGKATRSKVEGGQLKVDIQWDTSSLNPLGQLMDHQYREGFLSAVSVGFRRT